MLKEVFCISQQCMSKRFDHSEQYLDLNGIRTDPGKSSHLFLGHSLKKSRNFYKKNRVAFLKERFIPEMVLYDVTSFPALVSQNIEMILSRKSCMQAVVKIIEENIPEVRLTA